MITKFSYVFTFIVVLFVFQVACGQNKEAFSNNQTAVSEKTDSRTDNLKKQADELINALNKNDFNKFVELTHPLVIEKVGSKENLVSMMKAVADQNPKIFETVLVSVSNPTELVETNGQLFGVVPQKIEGTTLAKHKLVQDACVVGVSNDNGKIWKFVSGEKFDELFPSAKDKIKIVPQKTFIDGVEQ